MIVTLFSENFKSGFISKAIKLYSDEFKEIRLNYMTKQTLNKPQTKYINSYTL